MAFEITISISGDRPRGRRAGFEQLRDVVTTHRRAWAAEHLDGYLRARWETDLRAAAEAYNRALHAKGKAPTFRQTITASKTTIDRWFGGDVGGMLGAIGQRGPGAPPTYERVLPEDVYAFGETVHRNLGLVEEPEVTDYEDRAAVAAQRAARDHNTFRRYAAERAYTYVQMWEALGQSPAMNQVAGGADAARWLNESDLEAGWRMLVDAIHRALHDAAASPPAYAAARPQPPAPSVPPAPVPRFFSPPTPPPAPSEQDQAQPRRRRLLRRMLGGR